MSRRARAGRSRRGSSGGRNRRVAGSWWRSGPWRWSRSSSSRVVHRGAAATTAPSPVRAARTASPSTPNGPTTLAFQVRGTTAPMMAIIGAGTEAHPATSCRCRPDLTIVVPARARSRSPRSRACPASRCGSTCPTWRGLARPLRRHLPERVRRTAWTRAGGLEVNLGEAYPTKSGSLGPGAVTLTGQQAKAFLAGSTDDAATRWEFVLTRAPGGPTSAGRDTTSPRPTMPRPRPEVFAGAQAPT